ncbi:MAG: RNA methyltransferase [Prolixibacteraceae bacterium]|jgi:TrmH family RNA methyltransferase|nr:RNA methyltransferase [Prolixibacteraceae bacterium]
MISRQKIDFIHGLARKKEREMAGCFVAEGEKLVFDLINTTLNLREIYCTQEGLSSIQSRRMKVEAIPVSGKEMERISAFKNPSSVLALFEIPKSKEVIDETFEGINLVLDGIQDPGNLGTIIRTADWFGISNLFCSPDCADLYNPKCVQSTMGALARVEVHYLNLPELLKQATAIKIPVYGTFMADENLYTTELAEKALIILGSEGKGISSDLNRFLTKKISIPAYPAGSSEPESLNVAVSAAIVCAEFRRRVV